MNPLTRLRISTTAAVRRAAISALTRIAGPKSRKVRMFSGAKADRLTADLFSGTTSGAGELRNDLKRLRNRSRTLVRDTAEAKRYCALWEENVVGASGILLKPAALTAGGKSDTKLNDLIAEAWEEFSERTHCTVDGTLGMVELEQAVMRLLPMDGEYLVRLVPGRGKFGLQLQLLDPDQLDETLNIEPSQGTWIRAGVELDPFGRPVAYWLWDGHPSDNRRGERRRIPADQIIHGYTLWRPGATRGVPWLHAAITDINMLAGYKEAALVAARVAASAMGTIEGASDPDSLDDDSGQLSDVPAEFEPGRWWKLAPGEKATMHDPKHPTTSFDAFTKANMRSIAQAGGVSYTSLSGDLAEVNYSSIRAGLLSERDRYRIEQNNLKRTLLTPIYRRWLRMAQLSGALPISARDIARAERVRWQARGFPWVDPRADIEALTAEIRLGINSRTEAAAERGRDFEKVLEQIDNEEQLADQYGVDVSGATMAPRPADGVADATTTPPPARSGPLRIANG